MCSQEAIDIVRRRAKRAVLRQGWDEDKKYRFDS